MAFSETPHSPTRFVRVTTSLPVPAEEAAAMAHQLSTFEYVVRPILRFAAEDPGGFKVGDEFSARLWFLMFIPAWTHHLKIVEDSESEIYTNERSGPARVWNHRLTFTPTGEHSCEYTDEIEIEGGLLGHPVALFINVFFRYRQWRWRRLVS